MKHRYIGADPEVLEDGRPVAFGDEVNLNKNQVEANARLVDAGLLVAVKADKSESEQPAPAARSTENGKEGEE